MFSKALRHSFSVSSPSHNSFWSSDILVIKGFSSFKKTFLCTSFITGFVELYKCFDVKKILVKSFNESYSEQKCSISQRQGIITCIPKEGKSKYSLKNWRPIVKFYTEKTIALYPRLFQNLGEPADQECHPLPF
jgi:hypothetical protein